MNSFNGLILIRLFKTFQFQFFTILILLAFFTLFSHSVKAQFILQGKVLEAGTNLPVEKFTVKIDSVQTQFQHGTFLINTSQLPAQLIFNSPGHFSNTIQISRQSKNITVNLIPESINIQEIRIKAFSSERRLADSPGSIALITNRQILNEPTFTLAPIANNIPGVWMQSGSMNTNRLTIRGIGSRSSYGSNKIRAYFGDIPLTNGVGETTLEDLDLEQISNIEVIKGPSSGYYGSGLGGVLLINPIIPTKTQVTQLTSLGSYNTFKLTEKLEIATNKSANSLVYSHLHSDGYRENNSSNRHNLTWTSNFTKNRTTINLLGSFIKMDAFIPSSIDLKTFRETPEKAAANWAATRGYEDYSNLFGGISIHQSFNKSWEAKFSGFGHYNKNNELRPFNILQEENHYQGMRSLLEKKYTSGKIKTKLIFGDEFFAENYKWQTLKNNSRLAGDPLSDNQEFRHYNNLFILSDLNIEERVLVSASLNWNQTTYDYKDKFLSDGDQSGNHNFNPVFSPRLSTTWIVKEKLRFYSLISHGFSPPTLEETLLPNGQRNNAIKPETGWNFELGTKATVGQSLYVELSVYYMKVRNLLVAQRTAEDAYWGINAGSTNHPGIEFKMDYHIVNRPSWSTFFRINANLTRYRFADFVNNGIDYSGNILTGTPSSTSNWKLETNFARGFFVNLHYQTISRIPILDDNSIFSDAYQLANFMAGYEKTFNKIAINISSGVQNLFDAPYASMILINATSVGSQSPRYYYPGIPRNYKSLLSFRYTF